LKFSPLLLAVSSCLLASKFSEIDDNLMIVAELLHFINNVLHTRYLTQQRLIYQDVTRAELQTLTRFQWDAYRTISLDFVELYF
jgi:predicted XRE-type DNA-binding protein